MAIEDACVLARCLEHEPEDPARALARYETARMERTARAARGSTDMQYTFHHPALAEAQSAAEYIQTQWSPEKSRARYDWIYEYDATQVSIEATPE
jgi:salicylate hydroxylase